MENDEIDKKMAETLFQQILDAWIKPEMQKRKEQGRLNQDFELDKAQIVFSVDRNTQKIRFNEEVKEPKHDPNCGQLFLKRINNYYEISFDFRYNKKRAIEHINAAKEFFKSAQDNFSNNRLRPFFEDAFACAELTAKAILILMPDKELLKSKEHETRLVKFKKQAEIGNVKQEHALTYEKLYQLRGSSRYLCSNEYKKQDPEKIIQTLGDMIQFAENRLIG